MKVPNESIGVRAKHLHPMDEIRYLSRETTSQEQLERFSKTFCEDEKTCRFILQNKNLTENCKYILACSSNVEVKRLLAQQGEKILSTQTQLRLVLCEDKIVKEHLARTTTKEEIKEILFKSNPESKVNEKIRQYCLKRMSNMEILEKFILTASPEILDKYSISILSNRHLTAKVLNMFVIICTSLTEQQIMLIMDHPNFDPKKVKLP